MVKLKKSFKKKLAMTLVEVLVGAGIFAIGYSGILLGMRGTRYSAMNDMVKFIAVERATGIMNMIQCYPYEEEAIASALDASVPNVAIPFSLHSIANPVYDTSSGIVLSNGTVNTISAAAQNQISLRYRKTVPSVRNASLPAAEAEQLLAKTPFTVFGADHGNIFLMGPEDDDVWQSQSNPTTGKYLISYKQNLTNSFETAKAYFFDDVDDFDGYTETVEVAPNIDVTYTVSVSLIYSNLENFSMDLNDGSGTLVTETVNQNRYAPMADINFANGSIAASPLDLAAFPIGQQQLFYCSYYRNALFKKITVRAQWTYPPGSSNQHSIVIDNGIPNPQIGA